jgi:large subunit ribosomal protein L25
MQELEIEALPMDIPRSISVDVSPIMEIGQSILVSDLKIPKGVRVLVDTDSVVATVTAKITEEEELAMQQKAAGGVEEVKVETEEKKAEREAGKAVATEGGAAAPEAGKK